LTAVDQRRKYSQILQRDLVSAAPVCPLLLRVRDPFHVLDTGGTHRFAQDLAPVHCLIEPSRGRRFYVLKGSFDE
jgi:hypothetical protein